jgi:hypothetical protein
MKIGTVARARVCHRATIAIFFHICPTKSTLGVTGTVRYCEKFRKALDPLLSLGPTILFPM